MKQFIIEPDLLVTHCSKSHYVNCILFQTTAITQHVRKCRNKVAHTLIFNYVKIFTENLYRKIKGKSRSCPFVRVMPSLCMTVF